jgi:hypothetical protein
LDEIIDGEYWHSIPVMSESLLRRLGLEDNDDVKVPNPFGVAYQILPVNDEESRIIQNKLIGLYKEVYGWSDENCGHANEKLQESKQNDSEEYPGEVIRRSIKVLDRLLLEENFKDPL